MSTAIFLVLYPIFLLTSIRAAPPKINENLTFSENFKLIQNQRKDVVFQDIPNQTIGIFYFAKFGIKKIEALLEKVL